MNISRRSWDFWVYTHTYVNLPNDGCAYLRKLIWACIWFIPLTLLFSVYLLIEFSKSVINKQKFEYPVYVSKFDRALVYQLGAWCLTCMLCLMWFYTPPTLSGKAEWHILFLIGFVCWTLVAIVGGLLGIGYSIQWLINRIRYRDVKQKNPSILSIYIKSVKEKHCPKINIVD